MFSIKQVVVVGLVIVLMTVLLSLDLKILVNTKNGDQNVRSANVDASNINLKTASTFAKKGLNVDLVKEIDYLENKLANATEDKKLVLQKIIARKWDDVDRPCPSAFYYELVAGRENIYSFWLKAGDQFTNAYQRVPDSLVKFSLVQRAIAAYQKALELQPTALDSKIGLGIAYVSEALDPMKGIFLLLEVLKQEPNNIRANMHLGLFAMKSGQYEKAVKRFKAVLMQTNQSETWFYLASSYENMGMKQDAIAAYIKTKDLGIDPGLSQFVDHKIKKLKK